MPDSRGPSPALLAVLAVAIAGGAAASLLAAAAPVFAPTAAPQLRWNPPDWVYGLLFLLPFLIVVTGVLLRRLTQVHAVTQNRFVLFMVVVLALSLLFIAFSVLFGNSDGFGGFAFGSSSRTSGGSNSSTSPGGGPGNGGLAVHGSAWGLPGWLPIAVFMIAALGALAFVVPALYRRRAARSASSGDSDPSARAAATRQALLTAASRLEKETDPRSVVVDLYVELLALVSPRAGDLDPRTASEIQEEHLIPLGVRRAAAEQLTRLFEEARYSTHPLGPEAVARARAALQAALSDIGRLPVAA
jgi:hypothetical protein